MAVRERWNFHNDIAMPVERSLRRSFESEEYYHYADSVECGEYISSLEKILLFKANANNSKLERAKDFIRKYEEYRNVSGNSMSPEIAQQILDEFTILEKE